MVLGHNVSQGLRTQDVKITQDITFETMLLSISTLEGLKNSGFHKPSPIQLHGIPLGKCGFDLLLEAKSGTGKTAVFTVIALEKIDLNNGLQAIILAPTREIAAQICDVIKQIGGQYIGLTIEVVMGGLPVKEDIMKFKKKVHIVVGSPGRLHHLIRDSHIDVSAVRLLVLDEADKLMEKSFRPDIECIFSALPLQKQIIFSSATFPEESKAFINEYVKVSQHVCPDSNSVLLGISQRVTTVKHNANIIRQTQHRFEELLNILSKREFKQCLIFCNYQARVTDVYKMLKKAKWPAEKLYGQQEQLDRLEALKTLQEYKCRILIATDLAARGLDSSHVDLVVNFEMPHDWQTYLHRIGRAGRFGAYGLAVTIVTDQEETKFKELLNSMHFQLDIRNFWNDEKFEYNDDEPTTPVGMPLEHTMSLLNIDDETPNEDSYSEIWNTLVGEPLCSSNDIEPFDMLCSSFMETKDTVETFTDLLDSFKNNLDENIDDMNEYHCLTQKISIAKYKQHTKQNNFLANNHVKTELEFEVVPSEEITQNDIEPKSDVTRWKSNNRNKKLETPTKKSHPKNVKHVYLKEQKLESSQSKACPKRERYVFPGDKKRNNSQRKSYPQNEHASPEESDDNGYNTASYDFKKSQCYSSHSYNYSKHSYKSRSHNEYQYLPDEYVQWYNTLKLRTQQIEMAVYLNEISQL
ncbi:ATP-dependent RNA helicase DHH1-like [Leguminivora glycinivorella]|uniref:ATP-dependent RNA helicase DHH1-like n=1 Tax=Leguminivora glycinivorella TaxID=1035111 RepID=UPI00200DF80C|nr:ATP-dependent RNA helicase DHH1-like [Leguminivora glycinivorella]